METVDIEVVEGVAHIHLNRPDRLNAVVPRLVEDLCDALDQAEQAAVRAVILAGRGRAFCAGHDLRQESNPGVGNRSRRHLERIQDVTRKVRAAPHPVIAAVHGYALGAGCEFALCSDLVVAARGAEFGFPEVGVGLSITGGISHILPAAVGLARAKELVLLGERFTAERALALGLVNEVVDGDELVPRATEIAHRLADRPPFALALAKRALDFGAGASIEAAFEVEIDHAMLTMASPESAEAAETFRRRRSQRVGGDG
jgi:2-(1,2-epoxy-1,2-dihydrophenyl)acetyl-CoA isomerase